MNESEIKERLQELVAEVNAEMLPKVGEMPFH
jgi:hypothetical protein